MQLFTRLRKSRCTGGLILGQLLGIACSDSDPERTERGDVDQQNSEQTSPSGQDGSPQAETQEQPTAPESPTDQTGADVDDVGADDVVSEDAPTTTSPEAEPAVSCDAERSVAVAAIEEASKCEDADTCVLVLTNSGELASEWGNNGSGYIPINDIADAGAVRRVVNAYSSCMSAHGPSGLGLTVEPKCVEGRCQLIDD